MRTWSGNGSGPLPDCYQSNLKNMVAAIEREKKRRRDIGDIASVELYEVRKDAVLDAVDNEAELRRMREAAMTKAPGFWAFLPPKLGDLNQAFLRGDLPRDSSAIGDDRGERASQWRQSWRTEGFG